MSHITFDLKPVDVPKVQTAHRRIGTPIPVPESIPLFETLRKCEPQAVGTQVPVVWDRAEGFNVYDAYGNCWIDFTSGILVANAGHSHPHVRRALRKHIDEKPLHSYLFATEVRAKLVEKLIDFTPANLTKVFLLSTGSEAIEASLKLARLWGMRKGPRKNVLVSIDGSFHGRTMGAQMCCSSAAAKNWITTLDPDICQIPSPRGWADAARPEDRDKYGKEFFLKGLTKLEREGVDLERIAAFLVEGYQGIRGPIFFPNEYIQALRRWADEHEALMIVDEIQSGFARTGKLFAYEHYGVEADIVCCGKGISSSLPLSAVLGRGEIMDVPGPGEMTSTHTGNPLCCAGTLASIEVLEDENLIAASAEKGRFAEARLGELQQRYADRISLVTGRGLVWGVFFVRPGTGEPDIELADRVVVKVIQKGVMMFITGNGTIKICPPLVISQEALLEGIEVIGEALDECLTEEKS